MTLQVLRMERRYAPTLGRVRSRADLSIGETAEHLWVRIESSTDEPLDGDLLSLPAVCFAVLEDGQLIERGLRVPLGHLPAADWVSIAEWMTIRIEAPALAAQAPPPVRLQMEPSPDPQTTGVLVTSCEKWEQYVQTAPQIRLNPLSFAQNSDRQVVIRGTPLPPISGTYFVESDGVAVAAGWRWTPPVAANVVARLLQVAGEDLALLYADGTWERIGGEQFVPASRVAVRLSSQEQRDER